MKPERFRQIRNLFDAALDRDPASRADFVGEACQGDEPLRVEVERLIAAHLETAPLLDHAAGRLELLKGEPGRMEGRRISHYEVLRELGHGGMGTVYLAVRTDDVYRKPVALKVVRPEAGSEEVIARFRREREILASLDHPNLARLLDGGTTDEGLPYFVMDYVEGQPIHRYCDEQQLSINERLKLFQAVCAAVEYAHSRGVVHRDLKPGNILVTAEGTVKLLDFGIAKLLGSAHDETAAFSTRTGMLLMTPEYASPEQVRGEDIGAASDVYSLGVVLYELLTGRGPYRMRSRLIQEVVRVICEEEPEPPSTAVTANGRRTATANDLQMTPQSISSARSVTPGGLRRELSGDPDKIVLTALRKEPKQRYHSAAAFGEDIRRHLEGLPVLAHGQSVFYRTGKFLKQYRMWVLAGTVLGVLLATGAVKVKFPESPYLLGGLIGLPLGFLSSYLFVRREWGKEQASKIVFPIAVLTAAGLALVAGSRRLHHWQDIWAVVLALGSVYLAVILGRWRLRERWAGALLLDVRRPKPRFVSISTKVFVIYSVVSSCFIFFFMNRNALFLSITVFEGLSFVCLNFFWSRVQIRQCGIIFLGQLIPWRAIESYTWEPADNGWVMLRVGAQRSGIHFYRWHKRIDLREEQKPPVAEILGRQLAEWPDARRA